MGISDTTDSKKRGNTMNCPACGTEITLGTEVCEECHTSLNYLEDSQRSQLKRKILHDLILKLKPAPVITILEKESIASGIKLLQNKKSGCLVVVNTEGKISGIMTERDLLFKVAGTSVDLDHSPVAAIMTPHPECLSVNDTLAYALYKMGHGGYRHIPLVDLEKRPSGILSVRDIMQYILSVWNEDNTSGV